MLEYMSFLTAMYRSKNRDEAVEAEILAYIRENRADYVANSRDGIAARNFARIVNEDLSKLFFRIWRKQTKAEREN